MPTYLDNHATTRLDPRVLDAMLPWLGELWGNPSSPYRFGREARAAVDGARKCIADSLVPLDLLLYTTTSLKF